VARELIEQTRLAIFHVAHLTILVRHRDRRMALQVIHRAVDFQEVQTMSRSQLAAASVVALMAIGTPSPARAVEYPFTASSAAAALAWGRSAGSVEDITGDPRYKATANHETWWDFTPTCDLETDYLVLAFTAAEDKVKYTNEATKQARQAMHQHIVTVRFRNFSTGLNANDGAVGVLHQGSKTIHAIKKTLDEPDVETSPQSGSTDAGYYQEIGFDFDLRSFNPKQPFSVGMANVAVMDGDTAHTGEVVCQFSPDAK